MHSLPSREVGAGRRARVGCPKCGALVDLSRMRSHLRSDHQVGAAELENIFLSARRDARRGARTARR
ncbi:MAG: hypothetical protein ACREDK_09415 [Thermoplasmata archaeon]